jgi:hypothetical protein
MSIKIYQEDFDIKQKQLNENAFKMLHGDKIMTMLHTLNNKPHHIMQLNYEGVLELLKQTPCSRNMDDRLKKDFGMPSISTPRIIKMLEKKDFVDTLTNNALSSGSHNVKHHKKRNRHKKATHKRRKKATRKHHKKATKRRKKKATQRKKANKHHKKATHKRRRRSKH